MGNHHHHKHHQLHRNINFTCVLLIFLMFAFLPMPLPYECNAHFVTQLEQHHVYRLSDYSRPHFSPPVQPPTFIKSIEQTPAECMVDLTNELTYRILHYHSILNRNNFAFSPTALMSVLVALYEGSTGRSATEIKNVLQFPNNRDIVRVGYRDIHRRLRTYFFGLDNPLKGLSLNKENVTITRDYEAVLTFYGYDLGIDMVSSTAVPAMSTDSILSTATESTTKDNPETTMRTEETSKENTTAITDNVTFTTTPLTISESTTVASTTITAADTTTTIISESTLTTSAGDTTLDTTTTLVPKGMDETTATTGLQNNGETLMETTTDTSVAPTLAGETPTNEAAELISSFVAEPNSEQLSRIQKARVTRLPNAKLQAPLVAKHPQLNYLPSFRKSQRQTTNRSKRHLVGLNEFDSKLFVNLFNNEALVHQIPSTITGYNAPFTSYAPLPNEFEVDTEPNFIHTSSAAIKQNYNTDVITHIFYLSNQQTIYTTFKVYNAVLYYKYFDHLRMSVLELELDTPEYNLILLLPDYNTDLVTAAAALRSGPKLRLMRKQLKPKWVQAIIPDFKLHGTMFLTNDLQNLGISDIFEPNRADFRPMTDEKGIYVKHIEQAINIHIRTHSINQIRPYPCHSQNTERFVHVVHQSAMAVTDEQRIGHIFSKLDSRQKYSQLELRQNMKD